MKYRHAALVFVYQYKGRAGHHAVLDRDSACDGLNESRFAGAKRTDESDDGRRGNTEARALPNASVATFIA